MKSSHRVRATKSKLLAVEKAPDRSTRKAFGLYLARGKMQEARAAYTALIREYPKDCRLYAKRASCRKSLGDFAGAVRDLLKALSVAGDVRQRAQITKTLETARAEAALHSGKKMKPYKSELYTAAADGNIGAVRRLCDDGADIERGASARVSNRSPLAIACENGHLDVARLLLEGGADIEAKADTNLWDGPRYWTPLSFAAYNGHEAIVRLLAKRGADLCYVDQTRCNAIQLCLLGAHDDPPKWKAAKSLVAFLQAAGVPTSVESKAFLEEIRVGEKREKNVRENKKKRPERNAGHGYFVLLPGAQGSWFAIGDLPEGPESYEYDDNISLTNRYPKDATVQFSTHALRGKPNFAKELRGQLILLDALSVTCRALIVSKRMRDVLEEEQVTHVEYLPAGVKGPDGKVIADDYCIVNPTRAQDAIDREKSDLRMVRTDIRRINKLVLDRSNIEDDAKLFRTTGYSRHFFIRSDLVEVLQKAQLTGWRHVPAEGWNGMTF